MIMRMRRILVGLLVLAAASCVTINIYFPAAAVEKAAEQIVDEIRSGVPAVPAVPPADNTPADKPQSRRYLELIPAAHAADVDINVSTAAIRGLKESMKARFPRLLAFYRQGAVGEGRDGLVYARQLDQVSLKDRAVVSRLVAEENRDRGALYGEIVRANQLGNTAAAKVSAIFARTFRDKAESGWWVQDDGGSWRKK
ncbi:MAG: DUF1318 domain-containing protein [Deltaproteobacteria bacterium]|nr:DUF1318 domain-containing protein [Candidatus Anaeroferrophillacea bacterium]